MIIKDNELDLSSGSRVTPARQRCSGGSHESRLLWYVIQTKPQAEEEVKLRLENAEFKTFCPRIQSVVRGSKRSVKRVKPLFPSYLFVKTDLKDANIYHMVKYTRGVNKILGGKNFPVPIPEFIIDVIRERVGEGDILEQQMVFKKGDSVRIKSGLLKDLVGILEKPVTPAGRVKVLLNLVDKLIHAELSSADIEKM